MRDDDPLPEWLQIRKLHKRERCTRCRLRVAILFGLISRNYSAVLTTSEWISLLNVVIVDVRDP